MIQQWSDLKYWKSGEWQVIEDRLSQYPKVRGDHLIQMNPLRQYLFAALELVEFQNVKVAIFGQDPYPDHKLATGVAFSIPFGVPQEDFPPTLRNILREFCSDLGYPYPDHGNLEAWSTREGVLLWNVIPSCEEGKSLSHDWSEWSFLTSEIVSELGCKDVVLVFLGGVARRFTSIVRDTTDEPDPWELKNKGFVKVDREQNAVILEYSHPSPRGSLNSRTPFIGSRMFSTINDKLVNELGLPPVNWRL